MNQKHGSMTFFGIEIPVESIWTIRRLHRDKCGHSHMANSKKAKYDFCEKCGEARFYIEKKMTDVGKRLNDRLIFAELNDSEGNIIQKYYAVMEWYNLDVKINTNKYSNNTQKKDEFIALMKDVNLWKGKRFGIFVLQNVVPFSAFYKNKSIQNNYYGLSAICIDPDMDQTYAEREENNTDDDLVKPAS